MLYKVSNISDIATLINTKEARIQHLLRYVFFEKSFNMLNDQTCMYKPGRVCMEADKGHQYIGVSEFHDWGVAFNNGVSELHDWGVSLSILGCQSFTIGVSRFQY